MKPTYEKKTKKNEHFQISEKIIEKKRQIPTDFDISQLVKI